MERIVYKHVYNHLVNNSLIYKYQSGFLPKHSTVHQLLELYNSILNSLEKKEFSCFVFCDFSKAFDKVWHKGLIHKMNSYGIQANLIKWFENYLFKPGTNPFLSSHPNSTVYFIGGFATWAVIQIFIPTYFSLWIIYVWSFYLSFTTSINSDN